jgi:hypothetical protein
MPVAQFEEKEYEDAANGEIHRQGIVLASVPVIEAVLAGTGIAPASALPAASLDPCSRPGERVATAGF